MPGSERQFDLRPAFAAAGHMLLLAGLLWGLSRCVLVSPLWCHLYRHHSKRGVAHRFMAKMADARLPAAESSWFCSVPRRSGRRSTRTS
jgi:hypothetical protein